MNALTRRLIAKDFYLNRWLLAATVAGGLAGLAIAVEGRMRFNVGMLTWITAFVAFGVVLAMVGISSERKERTLQFVLSLPLSHGDYVRTKFLGLLLCYLVPWIVLSAGAAALVLLRPNIPDGLLPNATLLCVFMLVNFAVVLCAALMLRSEGALTLLIIATNMSVSLFIFGVGSLPSLNRHFGSATPVWNATFWIVLGIEAAVLLLCCSIPYLVAARRRDFL
jgi:ABC-2 type transport system permease protein